LEEKHPRFERWVDGKMRIDTLFGVQRMQFHLIYLITKYIKELFYSTHY
jgi:hypothetical protein